MLLVEALAGTGKTTTALWGLGVRVPKGVVCSDEQKAIVKLMRSYKWNTCSAQAYNTSIAKKLEREVPTGVTAATSNAFGHRAWVAYTGVKVKIEAFKNQMIAKELIGNSLPWKERMAIENAVSRLVALCKCYLMDPTPDNLAWLADRFDLEVSPSILDYAKRVFDKGVTMHDFMDYDDQNFMPIYHDIPIPQFDMVVVDELQDLNLAKQEMAFRSTKGPVIGIGDARQAIYGFSGADSDSMTRVWDRMVDISGSDAVKLPLTMTRRNPKLVVKEANKYVPELRCPTDAPDGTVNHTPEREVVKRLIKEREGAMVLCRVNAPLTSLAFRMIGDNRRCFIQGKDIGSGLKREITKHNDGSLKASLLKAIASIEKRIDKEMKSPNPRDNKIDGYNDKIVCLSILCGNTDSVDDFVNKVDALFKDRGGEDDHQLCSVHKAKGLERPNVVIYKPSKLPMIFKKRTGKKGMPAFQVQQEYNLAYVAYTRSQDTLTFAVEDKKDKGRDISEYVDCAVADATPEREVDFD